MIQVADVDGVATITVNVNVTPVYATINSTPAIGQTIKFDAHVQGKLKHCH
ncbi:MAG: hypothetical protein R3E08_00795 [Thiotrichaceae bacterium]